MIYFITARDVGRVKIGWSENPDERLKQLQTGCPGKAVIEATVPGADREMERALHAAFRPWRTHGEWFELSPIVEMAIHFINSGDAEPDDKAEYFRPFLAAKYPILEKAPELIGITA